MCQGVQHLAQLLRPLREDDNKFSRGSLLIAAGSQRFPGAATLASQAALAAARAGAGYVSVLTPSSLVPVLQAHISPSIPVLCSQGQGTTEGQACFDAAAAQAVLMAKHLDALVMGPGIGTAPETCEFVATVLAGCQAPVLLDADGINVVAHDLAALTALQQRAIQGYITVLTPHEGELTRLERALGLGSEESLNQRATQLAQQLGVMLVAKGPTTYIVDSQGKSAHSSLGGPELAKAGTGDVLAGIMGSMLAQGLAPFEAAELAVYLHSAAGKEAATTLGARSVMAEDLIQVLPQVLRDLEAAR